MYSTLEWAKEAIGTFAGAATEDYASWYARFVASCNLVNILAFERPRLFAALLRGNALDHVSERVIETPDLALDSILSPQFVGRNDILKTRTQLGRLQQLGDVADFIDQCRALTRRIPDMSEGERLYFLYKGMKPEITQGVHRQCPSTFEDAAALACAWDISDRGYPTPPILPPGTPMDLSYAQGGQRIPDNRRPTNSSQHQ